jgi:hypothetical protein
MKGHTGAMVSFGGGMPISFAHKHKLNVKSSTEAEVMGKCAGHDTSWRHKDMKWSHL